MLKLIRNNEKKVMAVVAVLSMIAFVASTGSGRGGRSLGGGEDQRSVGSVAGGKDLRVADLTSAKNELAAAGQYLAVKQSDGEVRPIDPVADLLGFNDRDQPKRLRDDPTAFALLRREAEAAGVTPAAADVQGLMAVYYAGPTAEDNPDAFALTQRAVTDLLAVRLNHDRMAEAVKFSRTAVANATARGEAGTGSGEQVMVNVVHLAAADYLPKVPPPTTQQVQAQFDRYADTLPDAPTPADPFGFGYKSPVRLTVQYVRLTPAAVERAVFATRTEYDWDVAARKYYLTHPDEFRIAPAGQSTTAPANAGPLRPFDQVRDRAVAAVRGPLVATRTTEVRNYLSGTAFTDWQASSTDPAARYNRPDYFRQLADDVRTRFQQVAVDVVDAGQLSVDQIKMLPDLVALTTSADGQPAYVLLDKAAVDWLGAKNPADPLARSGLTRPTPQLVEPDPNAKFYRQMGVALPAASAAGPMVVARATAVIPSQRPASLEAVRTAIEANCRTEAAYALAKADADKLLAAAKAGDLTNAAREVNRSVVATPPLSYTSPPDLSPLTGTTADTFVRKTFDALLAGYTPGPGPKPAAVVAMPEAGRLSVAQLLNVTPNWVQQTLPTDLLRSAASLRREGISKLTAKWYDPDAVIARMGYKAVKVTASE